MPPLSTEFNRYLDAIQPTKAQRNQAKAELDFIQDKLAEYISDDDPYKFVKALRNGSFAKATALRREESLDFDADIAIYVEDDGSEHDLENLIAYVEQLTRKAYSKRKKRKPQFELNESCVRVIFNITPKINIDIVPIVALDHPTIENWGLLPKRDGTFCYTSVSEHIEFVRSRNIDSHSVPFRKHVRLLKMWRNGAYSGFEKDKVHSFFLELVLGKAFDEVKPNLQGEALADLSKMIGWILNHGLESPIQFPDSRVSMSDTVCSDPVIVLDPINAENNVSSTWSISDRDLFLDRLDELNDVLRDARLECDIDSNQAIQFVDQALPKFNDWARN